MVLSFYWTVRKFQVDFNEIYSPNINLKLPNVLEHEIHIRKIYNSRYLFILST